MSIHSLPTSLLYQIISNVPFPSRWDISLVCKSWYFISTDPYLYQDIHLQDLELKLLVKALVWIEKLKKSPSVRSLNIHRCYCGFLGNAIVPLTGGDGGTLPLYSQLRTLTPKRRHIIYQQHGFTYYDQMFTTLTRLLLTHNNNKLTSIHISHCDLDWEMIRLLDIVICFGAGRYLTTWIYHDNYSNNQQHMVAAGSCPIEKHTTTTTNNNTMDHSFETFMKSCPKMKHFMWHHQYQQHHLPIWPSLESLVLMPNHDLTLNTLIHFVSQCPSLHTLELYDLACIHPTDMIMMTTSHFNLRHLKLTKFITTPLDLSSIHHLLDLFPQLMTLTYETNSLCYDLYHQSPPSLTCILPKHCDFDFRFNCTPTMDQLLLLHTQAR